MFREKVVYYLSLFIDYSHGYYGHIHKLNVWYQTYAKWWICVGNIAGMQHTQKEPSLQGGHTCGFLYFYLPPMKF